jgi:hypothetical protein
MGEDSPWSGSLKERKALLGGEKGHSSGSGCPKEHKELFNGKKGRSMRRDLIGSKRNI